MVRIASVALPGKALPGCGVSGMRVPDSAPFVVKGRVEGCFFCLSGHLSLVCFPRVGNIENLRCEKNWAGWFKNYRICLFGNNFNIIFAKINKLNDSDLFILKLERWNKIEWICRILPLFWCWVYYR